MNRHLARWTVVAAVSAAALIGVACGSDGEASGPPPFTASVVNSNLGVGANRVVIGLVNREDGSLVAGATVEARLFAPGEADPFADPVFEDAAMTEVAFTARTLDINEEHQGARIVPGVDRYVSAVPPSAAAPVLPAHEGDLITVYTSNVEFDRHGYWGLELDVAVGEQRYEGIRLKTPVLEETSEPGIGDPAPASEQLTLADVDDVSEVSSAPQPVREMLDETIEEALGSGKPLLVAFVTPAFCQTRFCGPVLETVLVPLWEEMGEEVEFVHVEPYDLEKARAGQLQPVDAVTEWGLKSEPFVFVVDREGRITAKFEGVMDAAEVREALAAVQ